MYKYNISVAAKFFALTLSIAFSFAIFPTINFAQSALDGFEPPIISSSVRTVALQADGKILIGGQFQTVGGVERRGLARLNMDGTLDTAFDAQITMGIFDVNLYRIEVLTDGKILIGGQWKNVGAHLSPNIARLNTDGSVDTTFTSPYATCPDCTNHIRDIEVYPNGQILISGSLGTVSGQMNRGLIRLNPNGSHDTSFTLNINTQFHTGSIDDVAIEANGQILVGGQFQQLNGSAPENQRSNFARLNSNGSLAPLNLALDPISVVEVQADGKFLVGGGFDRVFTLPYKGIARFSPDGTLDTAFNPNSTTGNGSSVTSIIVQPDGKILVGGSFTAFGSQQRRHIARFNAHGTLDSFNPGTGPSNSPNFSAILGMALQADGKILTGGTFSTFNGQPRSNLARLYENGALDATLNPNADALVRTVVRQTDGKILIGGEFTTVSTQTRNKLARINLDGTLDTTFTSPLGSSDKVVAITQQSDGKVIVGGVFQNNPQPATYIVRLNTDGTRDNSFNPLPNGTVRSIVMLPDGKILIGGQFTSFGVSPNTTALPFIARLNDDGSLDGKFNPLQNLQVSSTSGDGNEAGGVHRIIRQPDGKLLIGGWFNFSDNFTFSRYGIARLNTDGTFDSFKPAFQSFLTSGVYDMKLLPNGKIMAGGAFQFSEGQLGKRIALIDADGSLNTSFDGMFQNVANNTDVKAIAIQSDGKVLVGGGFVQIGGQSRSNIARLNTDGTADNFNPNSSSSVYSIVLQPDGKILLGGAFFTPFPIGGQPRNKIARLTNDAPAVQTLSVMQTTVSLTVSGVGPQLSRVVFEYSTDGINYTFLGEATNTLVSLAKFADEKQSVLAPSATTWTLTGLNLPSAQNIFIRAIGYDANGSEISDSTLNTVVFAPSAAGVSIGGRVQTTSGRGISRAMVSVTDSGGQIRTSMTNQFGYYQFADVAVGETYVFDVRAKGYSFVPQVLNITENIKDLNFTAQ